MRREKIEAWLLGSTCFSGGISLLTLAYYLFIDRIYLYNGRFPLLVPIIATALSFVVYALFKESNFKLYDDLQDFVFLDSVLADAMKPDMVTEIIDEDAIRSMPEITEDDVNENSENLEIPSVDIENIQSLDDISKLDLSSLGLAPVNSNDIPVPKSKTEEKNSNSVKEMVSVSGSPVKGSSTVGAVSVDEISQSAKKTLYKNKMLMSIKDRLDSIKSERNIPKDELERVCKDEVFISSANFKSSKIEINYEDMLFN